MASENIDAKTAQTNGNVAAHARGYYQRMLSIAMVPGIATRFAESVNTQHVRLRNVNNSEHAKDRVNKHCRSVHLTKTVLDTTTNVAVPVNIQSVLPVAGRGNPCGLPVRRRETQCPNAKHVK